MKNRTPRLLKSLLLSVFVTLLLTNAAWAGIIRRGSTRTATTSSSNLTINKPSGVLPGDVMIINLAYQGSESPGLSGWTLVRHQVLSNGRSGAVLYKIALANEPASYTFSLGSGGDNGVGALVAFAGVDVSGGNPFDLPPGTINTANSNTATAISVTTVSNGAAVIMLTQEVGSGRSWSGWSAAQLGTLTEIADTRNTGDASVGIAWKISNMAGSTGNGTATLSGSQQNGALFLALKPGAKNYFVRKDVANANLNLQQTSSWTDSETGIGGNNPANFTTANQLFNIGYNDLLTHSVSGHWTVTGTDSKILIGDGEAASTLSIGNNFVLSATLDLEPLSTLELATSGSLAGIVFGLISINSTVSYTSTSAAQTVIPAIYHHLTLTGNGLKQAGGDITVNGILHLGQNPNKDRGQLEMTISYTNYADVHDVNSTTGYNNLNSYILTMGPEATTTGNGDVTGKIRRTAIVSGVTYTFGNANSQLTFNNLGGGDLPTQITVVSTFGEQGLHVEKADAVKRLYQVLRTGGTNPTRMVIRLAYQDAELNSNLEPSLVLWDHHLPYGGITPHEHGKTNQHLTENWVELSNHYVQYLATEGSTSFTKYWMISGKLSTSITWLGASSTDWNNPSNWNIGSVPISTDRIVIPDATTTPRDPLLTGTITTGTIEIQPGGILNGGSATLVLTKGPAYNGGAGTWVNNGTFEPGTSTIIIDNDSATIAGNTVFHNVTVNTAKKVTLQDDAVVQFSGSLTINGELDASLGRNTVIFSASGITIPNANGNVPGYHHLVITGSGVVLPPVLQIAGNFTVSGSIDAVTNSSTVYLKENRPASTPVVTGAGTITFHNLQIDHPTDISFSGINAAVRNSLTLTNGRLGIGSGRLTVEGSLNRTNGIIDARTGIITLSGTASQSIPEGCFYDYIDSLEVDKAGAEAIIAGALVVNGLNLKEGSLNLSDYTLQLVEYVGRQNGRINATSGEVVLQGRNAQKLPAGSLNGQCGIMTIENPAGVTLEESVSIQEIGFMEGLLHIGNNQITAVQIWGQSPTAYISTPGSGSLKRFIPNGGAAEFPVGQSGYNPVTITNHSGAADNFDVRVVDEVYSQGETGDPLPLTQARVKRTWMINKATANNGDGIDFSFLWNTGEVNGDLLNPKLFHYNSVSQTWTEQTGATSHPTGTRLTYTGYTGSFSPFSVMEAQVAVPVTWLSFNASKAGESVLLTWKTASEEKSLDFQVQHSINGRSWTTIGSTPAKGYSSAISEYRFTHFTPVAGTNLYRILQRDLDGSSSFSKVEKIVLAEESNLRILGNPIRNNLLVFHLKEQEQLRIFNSEGRQVLQITAGAGVHQQSVALLPKGLYFLQSSQQTLKFMIQ